MPDIATPNTLHARLLQTPEATVRLRTPERDVRSGYHLTEFRLARIDALDCGRGGDAWSEAIVEVLDGPEHWPAAIGTPDAMRASHFASILRHAVRAMPAIGEARLIVEFGPDGLARYGIGAVIQDADGLVVALAPLRGACKARFPGSVATERTASCC